MKFSPFSTVFPLLGTLRACRDFFLLFWSWVFRNFNKCKFFAFFSLTYASIRAAVGIFGVIFSKIYAIHQHVTIVGPGIASSGTASSGFLDKVNAVFPVSETFAFMAAYGAVVILTTAYMFIRSMYNAVPLKGT